MHDKQHEANDTAIKTEGYVVLWRRLDFLKRRK